MLNFTAPIRGHGEGGETMADDFFEETKDEKVEETQEEPEKVKLGEKEYTQDELSKLVGLGEVAREYEEKWNRPIKDMHKSYTQTTQKLSELEQELEQAKTKQLDTKAQAGEELSPDELKARARAEAKDLGLISIDDVNQYIDARLEARDILQDTEAVVSQAKDDYGISTSVEDIIGHMQETGIRNPQKAFKDLYESEIDKSKEAKIESIKKPGMVTDSTASSGKAPARVQPNDQNIDQLVEQAMFREE